MSIEVTQTTRCDALDCSERTEEEIEDTWALYPPKGWHERDGFHYCPKCWPQVKKEIRIDEAE